MLMWTITYLLMKWALTWPKLVGVDGTSSANGPLSKCQDNVEETSPRIYGQMIKTDVIQINVVCVCTKCYGFLFI